MRFPPAKQKCKNTKYFLKNKKVFLQNKGILEKKNIFCQIDFPIFPRVKKQYRAHKAIKKPGFCRKMGKRSSKKWPFMAKKNTI